MPITTTPSGGPQGEFSTYTPIAVYTVVGTTTNDFTFSNIPTTYTDLVLVKSSSSTANAIKCFQFNGDTAGNYSRTTIDGDGSSSASHRNVNATAMISYAGHESTTRSSDELHIFNYSNPLINKPILARFSNAGLGVELGIGAWRNTAPITSIRCFLDRTEYWSAGSTFTLYGIKAAVPAPKAIGGDTVITDGTYWYHAFKTTGLLDVRTAITADVLVVAGGGAGGSGGANFGGGGGAGGLLYSASTSLTLTKYPVIVGAGGMFSIQADGNNGSNSSFNTLTAIGGGGGAGGAISSGTARAGKPGGSGGGASYWNGGTAAGGSFTSGQGTKGGDITSSVNNNRAGAGGGGAGVAGANVVTNGTGTAGGNGVNTYSTWATVTGTGVSGYYAGGGAGLGDAQSGSPNSGGLGGGGGAAWVVNGTGGTPNTGGGGGGSIDPSVRAGAGGSGVVIVRYAV